jgi:transcriptional regulator with XRE-family HTH domain
MNDASFAFRIRRWRRANGIKQSALAATLNVSQAAVSRWENGVDCPSMAVLRKITDLIADGIRDELATERRFIERLSSAEAIFDLDGIRLEATSAGLKRLWPNFSRLVGYRIADRLIAESRIVLDDSSLRRDILRGDVTIVSGITTRHTDLELDQAAKHRWISRIRIDGARAYARLVYEPCDPDLPQGIEDVFRPDDVAAG